MFVVPLASVVLLAQQAPAAPPQTITVCNNSRRTITTGKRGGDAVASADCKDLPPKTGGGTFDMTFYTDDKPPRSTRFSEPYNGSAVTVYVVDTKDQCPSTAENRYCLILH